MRGSSRPGGPATRCSPTWTNPAAASHRNTRAVGTGPEHRLARHALHQSVLPAPVGPLPTGQTGGTPSEPSARVGQLPRSEVKSASDARPHTLGTTRENPQSGPKQRSAKVGSKSISRRRPSLAPRRSSSGDVNSTRTNGSAFRSGRPGRARADRENASGRGRAPSTSKPMQSSPSPP